MKKEWQFQPVKSIFDIVDLLKACATERNIDKGSKIHAYIREHTVLEKNSYVANSLVTMYAKCGALTMAEHLLKELPVRNVVTWSALIAAYTQQGQGEEALKCFDSMQHDGHSPDAVAFTCALKACGSIGAIAKGEEIHDKIVSLGMLEKSIVLGGTLVDMYARCGVLTKAQEVLELLPVRNVVTWNVLIGGYAQQGQGEEALKCFDSMQHEGHSPDIVTFIGALKACGSIGAATRGEHIHHTIDSMDMLKKDIVLGSTIVDMYAKCGAFTKAQQVLEGLAVRNVVTWCALIAGYAHHGQGEEVLRCFDIMQSEGLSPNVVTFTCALKACACIGALAKGEEIHDRIVSLGMLEKDIVLGNTLLDMYAKCGVTSKAQQVFEELPVRNVVTWNALITGYWEEGQEDRALKCFDTMQCEGHSPDAVTFIYALKICGSMGAAAKGEEIHDKILCLGILESNIMLGSALVEMYARCGAVSKAQEVLKELPIQDVAMWSAIIEAYAEQGQGVEALKCYYRMQHEGHIPDVVAFTSALKACVSIGAITEGEQIHEKIVSMCMLKNDTVLGSTLVDMYAKCGAFAKARELLEEFSVRNVITWNALIAGYVEQGRGGEALTCIDSMQQEGHSPDVVTFACALKACGAIGAAAKGEQIHGKIVSLDVLEKSIELWSALMDMYAKCAALAKALEVFKEPSIQNVVTWTIIIGGYSQQGQSSEAWECFETMQSKGVKPNSITLIKMLNVCSHSGLLDQAELLFSRMNIDYGIIPGVEHYICMVDLFGRARKFNKALMAFEKMLFAEYLPAWACLLGACCKCGEVKIGRLAFERLLCLDKDDPAIYVCMADLYAGRRQD